MFSVGFDYGTSHCAVGVLLDGAVRLLPMEGTEALLPSMLWYPNVRFELPLDRQGRLRTDSAQFAELRFGSEALATYLQDPTKGYFVKSPKSFLGAPGLLPQVRERFERVVAAMMAKVRLQVEAALQGPVHAAVIGRPVNFQGPTGAVENDQALAMLRRAAHLAGFAHVDFLYEPLAAAFEYEARLNADQTVLVVDVGGGTTDCSLVQVGPSRCTQPERSADMLGHSGERLGGNDYDQALALERVVPQLGWQAPLRSGLPVPNHYLVDAITINDVNAQARFYSAQTGERLQELEQDCETPEGLRRLLQLQRSRGSYRLLRQVELAKIALSESTQVKIDMAFVEPGLQVRADRQAFAHSARKLTARLQQTVAQVLESGVNPELVYLTGGMAQAPLVRALVQEQLGGALVLDSDHFTSVTEGLARWAALRFAA